jgi:uncharacterized protein (DUF2235 family)
MMSDNKNSKGKNIVVFSDGTGMEGGVKHNTNVYKIFNMIEDRTKAQIAFYDQGIGTTGNVLKKLTAKISGAGISKDILQCYQFISDHYMAGDDIFLFGFSRGATTVRSLAGFISFFGMLPHSRPDLVRQAWDIYRIEDEKKRKDSATTFLQRNHTTYCNIKFLGVWDSVAALIAKHKFHDLKLNSRVQHGYHALSIDDEREAFHPMPWRTTDEDGSSLLGKIPIDPRRGDPEQMEQQDRQQTVKQVWFCGVHTDVGGGYEDHGVSDIPLTWMLDKALTHGLRLYQFNGTQLSPDIEGKIHDSRDKRWKKVAFTKKVRSWDPSLGKPFVHASVLERKRGKASAEGQAYRPWILEGDDPDASAEDRKIRIEHWDNRDDVAMFKYGLSGIEDEYQAGFKAVEG